MKFLIGKKIKMTQYFDEKGVVHPATLLSVSPLTVTQVKNADSDGYTSVQVGYGTQKASRLSKPVLGHLKGKGPFEGLKEFRISESESVSVKEGDTIAISEFSAGDAISISGVSKGKGFQGVVKRHGFHGGRRSHGQKHSEREPGSIGAGGVQRVFKGKRMAGRMGSEKITLKNVKLLSVDNVQNQILIKGPVPGSRGTLIEIRSA